MHFCFFHLLRSFMIFIRSPHNFVSARRIPVAFPMHLLTRSPHSSARYTQLPLNTNASVSCKTGQHNWNWSIQSFPSTFITNWPLWIFSQVPCLFSSTNGIPFYSLLLVSRILASPSVLREFQLPFPAFQNFSFQLSWSLEIPGSWPPAASSSCPHWLQAWILALTSLSGLRDKYWTLVLEPNGNNWHLSDVGLLAWPHVLDNFVQMVTIWMNCSSSQIHSMYLSLGNSGFPMQQTQKMHRCILVISDDYD